MHIRKYLFLTEAVLLFCGSEGVLFSWKIGAGQSNEFLEMGDGTKTFFFLIAAKVLSDAHAAGHNLIQKIAKDLVTEFCFKAFHLSASAYQKAAAFISAGSL